MRHLWGIWKKLRFRAKMRGRGFEIQTPLEKVSLCCFQTIFAVRHDRVHKFSRI